MSVRLLDRYNLNLQIDEMKKTEVPLTDNVNRNLKGKDKVSSPNFDVVTLVNLLGSYGNFEVDSNGDGLADGWTKQYAEVNTSLSTDSVFKSYSQVVELTGDANIKYNWIKNTTVLLKRNRKYFIIGYLKTDTATTTTRLGGIGIGRYNAVGVSIENSTKNVWEKLYFSKVTESDYDNIIHVLIDESIATSEYGKFHADGLAAYDLTDMGKLPRALQNKYGVTNWVDLTDEQLNNELDYVSSVSTLGWSWDTGKRVEVVENEGINLFRDDNQLKTGALGNKRGDEGVLYYNNIIKVLNLDFGIMFINPTTENKTYTLKIKSNLNAAIGTDNRIEIWGFDLESEIGKADISKKITTAIVSLVGGFERKISFTANKLTGVRIGQNISEWEINSIMLYEGADDLEYIPPRQDKLSINTYGFNYFGVSDAIRNNQKIKMWEKQEIKSEDIINIETDLTNHYRVYFSLNKIPITGSKGVLIGEQGRIIQQLYSYTEDSLHYYVNSNPTPRIFIFIEKSKIEAMSGSTTLEKAQNYFNTYPHTLFYQLATPEVEEIETENSLSTLNSTDNQFVYSSQSEYKFLADGINITYTLPTSSTNYDVYVSGKLVTEGITKGASSVTFLLPPSNGKVIKVVYNKSNSRNVYAYSNLLEPVGSPENFEYFKNISVTEVIDENRRNTKRGLVENTIKNKHYEIDVMVDMFEDAEQFIEKWQGKKFQITLEHGSKKEIYAPCEIIDNVIDDYWNAEGTTIKILAQSKYWA